MYFSLSICSNLFLKFKNERKGYFINLREDCIEILLLNIIDIVVPSNLIIIILIHLQGFP